MSGYVKPSKDQVLIRIYLASKIIKGHLPELGQDIRTESEILSFVPVPDSTETSEDNLRITAIRNGEKPFHRILVWRGELFESAGRTWLKTPNHAALDPARALAYARERRLGFVVPSIEYDLAEIEKMPGPGPVPAKTPEPEPEPEPGSAPEPEPVAEAPGWHTLDGSAGMSDAQYVGCNRCLGVRGFAAGHPCPVCKSPEYSLIVFLDGHFQVGRLPAYEEPDSPGRKAPVSERVKALAKVAARPKKPKAEKPKAPEPVASVATKPRPKRPELPRDLPGQEFLFD